MRNNLVLLKKAVINWYGNDPFSQSAAISYYTIFSFPAIAFIYLSLASIFADQENVQKQLSGWFSNIVGIRNSKNIEAIIENTAPEYTNLWALVLGGVILLFAALRLFLQLQLSLNKIWNVKASENINIWKLLKQRVIAFGVMLGILFIMLATLLITTILTSLGDYISSNFSENLLVLMSVINFILSLTVISLLFTILLKLLPDVYIKFKYAAIGGALSAILFILGQYLIGLYFDIAKPASAYGVTASIILLMIWVSYTCVILLFGAEITKVIQQEYKTNMH